MKAARIASIGVSLGVLSAVVRCIPSYEFGASPPDGGTPASDGGVGGGDATTGPRDGGSDGTTSGPHDAASEGSSSEADGGTGETDAEIDAPSSFAPTPTTILSSVGIATETGNAQQQHLVFATNSQRWWFFYIDADPMSLHASWSVDFATWTDATALTLPMGHGGEGRNFSIAYKNFGGRDVIHAATSLHDDPKRIVWDTRATISGAKITWETSSEVHDLDDLDEVDGGLAPAGSQGGDSCDPDGPSVTIAPGGTVTVATSWVAVPGCCYCDSNFATSLSPDNGTTWDAGFQLPLFHITVPGTTSARQVVALSSGNLLGGWETADNIPPSDVTWGATSAGAWVPEDQDDPNYWVFPQPNVMQVQEKNDWSFCRISDNAIHAVHRKYALLADAAPTQSRVFEDYVFDGSSWTFDSTLADDVGIPGSGVVLVTNGTSLLAAAIAQDGSDSIRYATWTSGTWSAWSSLVGPDGGAATRAYLSGSGCDDPGHPAIVWTEGASPPYQVIAVPVAGLMP